MKVNTKHCRPLSDNADGYGKWANLPISNDKGLTIYYTRCYKIVVFLILAGCWIEFNRFDYQAVTNI